MALGPLDRPSFKTTICQEELGHCVLCKLDSIQISIDLPSLSESASKSVDVAPSTLSTYDKNKYYCLKTIIFVIQLLVWVEFSGVPPEGPYLISTLVV